MSEKDKIYIHPDVEKVRSLHDPVLSSFDFSMSIYQLLENLSENLFDANQVMDERSFIEAKNFLKPQEIKEKEGNIQYTFKQAREIMARQHGYQTWEEVKLSAGILFEKEFEFAVDCIADGRLQDLKSLLNRKSHLVLQRSNYQHKATLLHYVAANGVEIRRQTVPFNLADITELLLAGGSDPQARGFFYGRMMSTEELLKSGTHTRNAGVYEEVMELVQST